VVALAAAFPPHGRLAGLLAIAWLSLIGWTWLARRCAQGTGATRCGFVLAAHWRARGRRIVFQHLIPAVSGHLVVSTWRTGHDLAETALTFRHRHPPTMVSWGTLLQEAQNTRLWRISHGLLMRWVHRQTPCRQSISSAMAARRD